MGIMNRLSEWRDNRIKLLHLNAELQESYEALDHAIGSRQLRRGSDEYNFVMGDFFNDIDLTQAEIYEIETKRALQRAEDFAIPVPERPRKPDDDNEYWDWCGMHDRPYLNTKGLALIRRESYMEMEMRSKLWLSWAAIGISVTSLAISVLRS